MTYPFSPGFQDTETSRLAAQIASATAGPIRDKVLALYKAYGPEGLTADEAAALMDKHVLSIRPRVTELKVQGVLKPTGIRRLSSMGLQSDVLAVPVKQGELFHGNE